MLSRNRLIFISFLVIIVLVTVSVSSDPQKNMSGPEKFLLEAMGALQKPLINSARGVENIWLNYFYLVDVRQENIELQNRVDKLNGELSRLSETELANERLTKLLEFTNRHKAPYIGAQVVAWDPKAWFKTITIDRGSQDGVRVGMPVVSDLGLVGRVVELSPHFSRVLLVIDYHSTVDAMVRRSRVRGTVAGQSEEKCDLKYVLKNDDLKEGDIVITSGLAGAFPRGLPLGTVTRVTRTKKGIFMDVEVLPTVDFNKLEEILVVLTEQPPF